MRKSSLRKKQPRTVMTICLTKPHGQERNEDMKTIYEIIRRDDLIATHANANFGNMTPRQIVNEGVLKYSMGYYGGSVMRSILVEHGLIRRTRSAYKSSLTEKGKAYLRAMYRGKLSEILSYSEGYET